MNPDTIKPKLIPVQVPWKVVEAVPVLTLMVIEQNSVKISFYADFGPINPYTGKRDTKIRIEELDDRPPIIHNPDRNKFIQLVFPFTTDIRLNSALSEGRTIDYEAFDWSETKPQFDPEGDMYVWLRQHIRLWQETELCPLPNMYSVASSTWLATHPDKSKKHYVILGEDMWIEILGKDWRWEFLDEQN